MQNSKDMVTVAREIAESAQDRVDLWVKFVNEAEAAAIAEIGVYRGEFAEQLLRSCGHITSYLLIDPWRNLTDWNKPANHNQLEFDAIFEEAMGRVSFAVEKTKVLRAKTKELAREIPDESLDFIYIDGDHTLKEITIDLMLLLSKCKIGGLIGGDDFASARQHGIQFEPTLVCPYAIYFAEAKNLPIICLPFSQFLIINDPSMEFQLIDLVGGYNDVSVNSVTRMDANGLDVKRMVPRPAKDLLKAARRLVR